MERQIIGVAVMHELGLADLFGRVTENDRKTYRIIRILSEREVFLD